MLFTSLILTLKIQLRKHDEKAEASSLCKPIMRGAANKRRCGKAQGTSKTERESNGGTMDRHRCQGWRHVQGLSHCPRVGLRSRHSAVAGDLRRQQVDARGRRLLRGRR